MAELSNYINNASKSAISQETASVVCAGLANILKLIGLPETLFLSPLVQGTVVGLMNTWYDDFNQRRLSKGEISKLEQFFKMAISTFYELSDKNTASFFSETIDNSQLEYAYEVAEDVILTAIRQSERKKVDILGRYFGRKLYEGNSDWQDIHQILSMAGVLTFRQLVMIRLISEKFYGIDDTLYIGNPSACVEINRLLDYGIWAMGGAPFSTDNSVSYPLKGFAPTKFSHFVCKSLMLDKLSVADIKRTIESLCLTSFGPYQKTMTANDYDEHIKHGLTDKDVISECEINDLFHNDI